MEGRRLNTALSLCIACRSQPHTLLLEQTLLYFYCKTRYRRPAQCQSADSLFAGRDAGGSLWEGLDLWEHNMGRELGHTATTD